MKKFLKSLDKKQIRLIIIITVLSLIMRVLWLPGKSGDYLGFLKPWVEDIRELGYFKALKYNIGNYNVPYIILLVFVSFIKGEPLVPIKILSIIFDFICAIYGAKIVNKLTNNKWSTVITYLIIICLPTVLVNGAMWAQCDSIYTSFILMSLYYLIDKKYTKSFLLLGVSFAFKLQFIFILPLYVLLLFREKKVKFYHFLLILLVNIILCLPAIIAGRGFMDVISIYFSQVDYYLDLVLNFPNLYNLIQSNGNFFLANYDIVAKVGVIVSLSIFACIWLYTLFKKVKFNPEKILLIGIWSVVICTYFLPRMHDRYMFVADVLSVIWFMAYQKKFYMVVVINLISLFTYFRFLFHLEFIGVNILSIIYFIVIMIFTVYVIKELGENNEDERVKVGRKKLRKVS